MKLAIVHDWMVWPAGSEKVVLEMHRLWPDAPIYTSAYAPEKFPEFADADVRPLWIDRIALAKRKHQLFSIPRAVAFRGLDLSDYDLVLSSTTAEAKYVRTGDRTLHICYCNTPIRYYWSDYERYRANPPFGKLNPLARVALPVLVPWLRRIDLTGAAGVDRFIANSENVRSRIARYYGVDSHVIHPPAETERFRVADGPGEHYLVFGRHVPYKRLDVAIDAFNELGLPLVVAGTGEEVPKQQARSAPNIRFVGRVPDEELADLYARSIALVFPGEEDFGIIPVEAMAAGRPVIAYGRGGVTETVVDGVTGLFFAEQTGESLAAAVREFQTRTFDPAVIRRQAETFDSALFREKLRGYVEREWAAFSS